MICKKCRYWKADGENSQWGACSSPTVFPPEGSTNPPLLRLHHEDADVHDDAEIQIHCYFGCRHWKVRKTLVKTDIIDKMDAPIRAKDIREIMKASKLTQSDLAKLLGVDRRRVWSWLNKSPIPPLADTALKSLGLFPQE